MYLILPLKSEKRSGISAVCFKIQRILRSVTCQLLGLEQFFNFSVKGDNVLYPTESLWPTAGVQVMLWGLIALGSMLVVVRPLVKYEEKQQASSLEARESTPHRVHVKSS